MRISRAELVLRSGDESFWTVVVETVVLAVVKLARVRCFVVAILACVLQTES